jgi:hypothetical protein
MPWETHRSTCTNGVAGTSRRETVKRVGDVCEATGKPSEEAITRSVAIRWESERPIVALMPSNVGGAKAPYRKRASIKERTAD